MFHGYKMNTFRTRFKLLECEYCGDGTVFIIAFFMQLFIFIYWPMNLEEEYKSKIPLKRFLQLKFVSSRALCPDTDEKVATVCCKNPSCSTLTCVLSTDFFIVVD